MQVTPTFSAGAEDSDGARIASEAIVPHMKILVIEDDLEAAAYMTKAFREAGIIADHASDGESGLFMGSENAYDVMVIDRMLPRRDGLSVISELRKRGIDTPVLILSALGQVDDRVTGLRAGGDDYLPKPYAFSELLARVEVLGRRKGKPEQDMVYRVGDLELDRLSHEVTRGGKDILLQPREFRLLEYLMKNAGQVVTRTMLLENAAAEDNPLMFRSTAVRLSALYILLFALCAAFLVFYVTALSERLLAQQTRQTVQEEVQDIQRAYDRGGVNLLVRIMERRARQPGANLYVIAGPNGEILAGNVASVQPGVLDKQGWTSVPFGYEPYAEVGGPRRHLAIANVLRVDNGLRIMVGRDLGDPSRFRYIVRQALMVALAIMGLGALVIWFGIGRNALKRIDRMSAASQKIMAGDLSQRLPVGRSGDEFDRLSDSLNAMLGRIEKLNEGLRQVSDNIAHDLKTPLTRLRNKAADALSEDREEVRRTALEGIIAESDQLIRTFNALLMISRVEAGSIAAEMTALDLSAISADCAELYEPVAEEAGLNLVTDIAPGLSVRGNRELIGQAIFNLLDNAIKYTGGNRQSPEIVVRLVKRDQTLRLSVCDNGPGVPADKRGEVTKRFVRLDESRSKPGTGLGLSLVEAVMDLHGVDSAGGGTWLLEEMVAEQLSRLGEVDAGIIRPLNRTEAKMALAELDSLAKTHPQLARELAAKPHLREFLAAAFSLSPHLLETGRAFPAILEEAACGPIEPILTRLINEARAAWEPRDEGRLPSETEIMIHLRQRKRAVSLLVALADLARLFSARDTTNWLTAIAEACVGAAIDHLLLAGDAAGKLTLANPQNPSAGSGLIVLGMGKLGGRELNYSSDIDIVVFFEPEAGILVDPSDASETYARMMRRLVRILQERTADGYVFRTDLRLRPDPGSTPLAVSVDAALIYYEGRGQNWERAAFIKARPIAGDLAAGEDFLRLMTPFVFRKYLDYAAIADIHSIKRQIHVHKGHGAIAVKGHNVKLGRGGIREIEFFAQTQQLIAGGRAPALRARETQVALTELAKAGWISSDVAQDLTDAYWFLRDVEHRIQMVHDEQTHLLPRGETELRRIAHLLGFADSKAFSAQLEAVLRLVETSYAQLFEQEPKLSGEAGNLVFTGQNNDPETLKTLERLGFSRPADIAHVIRTWHYGRYRATQSAEARERLTELTPQLLKAFGESRRADEALLRFDSFLKGLPAGIQLFSLVANNPTLLSLIVTIMSAAPRLADIVAARPHVFDGMLDPRLMAQVPTRAYLGERLAAFLGGSRHYEETLDRLRIFAAEQRFLIGIRLLTGAISGADAGRAFTHLADLLIEAAFDAVLSEMRSNHGSFPGGRVAVMGMGKLGSFELTAGSDVDIILLYDYDSGAEQSDGAKPLDAQRYFTRVTQRLIAALSAPTAEGLIFEVDLRLRPSGNKGPVATRINAFAKYQREEAWTWEHMALTRARLVCGTESLVREAEGVLREVVSCVRDAPKTAADVAEMRALIEREKPPRDRWDLKLIPGGLIDLEFIAQYLRLVAAGKGVGGDLYATTTEDALKELGAAMMEAPDLDLCLEALRLFTELSQIIRLCVDGPFDAADAPAGLIERVCRAGDCPDLRTLEGEVKRLGTGVRDVFRRTVGR
eukprot:g20075.t1